MNIINTEIEGVFIIEPRVHGDARGYFMESFREDIIHEKIGPVDFVQDNEAASRYGVLRGLHYQREPHAQAKLVRVIEGEVLDVVVDIRRGSPTFGRHVSVRLSSDNKRQLFVPKGFAHGYVVLGERAVFAYKCDDYYHPECDAGLAFDDSQLGIDWIIPREDMILSEKDLKHPSICEL